MFARRRRFAALLIATIAVGIGAATSIFSLVDVVLWKPLPYRDADRLYWIARTDESWRASPVLASRWDNLSHAWSDFRQWEGAQKSFEATGAWFATSSVLATDQGLEQIATARATASLAPLLGVNMPVGRWFLPGEDNPGGSRLAVLSFESWQARYGTDQSVIGRRITLNAQPHNVIGVLPRGFRVAGDSSLIEVWTPAGISPTDWQRGNFNFRVFGRLRPSVTVDDATREATRLLAVPDGPARVGIRLEHLQSETVKAVRMPLTILLASAVLLLVIACGNVATLLVGETASRDVEISTRVSLGATRMRMARQLLTENLLLATVGGAAGCAIAVALVRVLRFLAPPGIPRIETAHVDGRAIAFAIGITMATALVFSLAPLVAVLRTSPASTLRAGSSRLTRQRGYLERGGVVVQSALVVVLLAGAALLVRTHRELLAVDPGFRAANLLGVRLRFLPPVTRYRDAASRRALVDELAAKVAALPGVTAASGAFPVPFQGQSTTSINIAGSPVVAPTEEVAGTYIIASSRLFETMGIALRAGRLFDASDEGPGSSVIVSESLVRRYWPNASPIGQRIQVDDIWRTVVGVVADVRHRSVEEEPRPTFYLPAAQAEGRLLDAVVLRHVGRPARTDRGGTAHRRPDRSDARNRPRGPVVRPRRCILGRRALQDVRARRVCGNGGVARGDRHCRCRNERRDAPATRARDSNGGRCGASGRGSSGDGRNARGRALGRGNRAGTRARGDAIAAAVPLRRFARRSADLRRHSGPTRRDRRDRDLGPGETIDANRPDANPER